MSVMLTRNGRQCAIQRPVNHTFLAPVRTPADDIERLTRRGV